MAEILGDKYELARLVGEGGMGSVWEAQNRLTGKRVAVKRMSPQLSSDPDAVERFLREARAATAIEHPNVVDIYDIGLHEGVPFIVMELLEGESLAGMERRVGALDPEHLVELLFPAMQALAAAHARGIVHRDLKPDNIFLSRRASQITPKLLDFGISKLLGDGDLRLTRSGAIMGTPFYMAPEQAAGRKDIDAQTDVYALGVILYEALGGQLPFRAENYNALLVAILTTEPTPLAKLRSSLDPEVVKVVERAMHRDRKERYASVEELGLALEKAVGREGLWQTQPHTSTPPPTISGAHASAFALAATMATPQARELAAAREAGADSTLSAAARHTPVATPVPTAPRSRAPLAVAVIATAALLGVGLLAMRSGGEPSPATAAAAPAEAAAPVEAAAPAEEEEEEDPEDGVEGGDATLTARALACAAEADHACVVETLGDHAATEADVELLVDAHRALDQGDEAATLAHDYLARWPRGARAVEYAEWLATRAAEAPTEEPIAADALAEPAASRARPRATRASAASAAAAPVLTAPAVTPSARAPEHGSSERGASPERGASSERGASPERGAERPPEHRSGGLDPTEF